MMSHVESGMLEALKCYLDTLHSVAFGALSQTQHQHNGKVVEEDEEEVEKNEDETFGLLKKNLKEFKFFSQTDQNLILTLSNVVYSKNHIFPEFEKAYRKAFRINRTSPDFPGIFQLTQELEELITNKYLRNKTVSLNALVKRGVLLSGIDWLKEDPPESKSYIWDG
jgi:hypothetical protein